MTNPTVNLLACQLFNRTDRPTVAPLIRGIMELRRLINRLLVCFRIPERGIWIQRWLALVSVH